MIIVSNHVKDKVKLNDNIVIRINVAWVKTISELKKIIKDNSKNPIYLDFPEGRTKPPKPTLSLQEVIGITHHYKNIKYFAISNAEEQYSLKLIRKALPSRIKIVPKIETVRGIANIRDIVKGANTDTIMLDKEDLYTAVNADSEKYKEHMDTLRLDCFMIGITILELQGVIFYESE